MAGNGVFWSHQATFEASPICASRARDFVTRRLVEHRLLYLVDPVRLVASELATNALVHAQTAFTVTPGGLGADRVADGAGRLTRAAFPTGHASDGSIGSWTDDRGHRQPGLGDRRRRAWFQGGLGILRPQGNLG
jgi:hypothetical protein